MAQSKPTSARRREIRRHMPRQTAAVSSTLRQHKVLWASLFATLFALIGGAVSIYSQSQPRVVLDQRVDQPIVARVEFAAVDQAATLDARQRQAARAPEIFTANAEYLRELNAKLYNFVQTIGTAESIDNVTLPDGSPLTPQAFAALRTQIRDGVPTPEWERNTRDFLQRLFELAIVPPHDANRILDTDNTTTIRILHPDPRDNQTELTRGSNVLFPVDQVDLIAAEIDRELGPYPRELRPVVRSVVLADLQPTYLPDPDATAQRRQALFDGVDPIIDIYQRGDTIVALGERIGPRQIELLARERAAFHDSRPAANHLVTILAITALLASIAIGQWAYILAFNPRVAENPMRGLAFMLLTTGMLVLAVVTSVAMPNMALLWSTLPTVLVAMTLAVVYEQRFALAIGASQAIVVALVLEQPAADCLVGLIGVGVVAALLDEVRTTSTLVRTGFFAGIGMALAAGLGHAASPDLYLNDRLWPIAAAAGAAGAAGLVAGFIMQGLVPYIEKLFHVTTAMTLRELNDASNPLLQRMAQEAPGTYAHSLRIADMAEAAADTIGANGLLCRVGAMYHDIGKINKPAYFIENQGGGPNRHAKLSPAMSLLIIVGHVKDGIEMAREYGLPGAIRHFIESHHGTTLVEYFYHAAKKKTEAEEQSAPSEFEFRYPGPKPQSREAAIMLLCDGVEAAARALPEPTPVRIEQLVHSQANKRLMDGQFDDANLTLAELSRVEASITKTLNAIYHARIKYPDGGRSDRPAATPKPAEQRAESA
ncbi:MAG: HDIG domain-containing metalloprotein [Planctomycetota bacterium]